MKNILLGLVVLFFLGASCEDPIDPTPEPTPWDNLNPGTSQWGLVINYTASWCGPCGNWGVPLMNNCVNLTKVVGIVVKASGDPQYNATIWNGFYNDRTNDGAVPAFWMGDDKSTNIGTLQTLMTRTPKAAIAMKHEIVGDSMIIYSSINTLTGFDPSAEYHLGVVVQEDGLQYAQNGITDPEYKHKYIARKAHKDLTYGDVVTLSAGVKNNFRHAIKLESTWVKANCYASVVLYKKEGTTKPLYKFINASWSRVAN